VIGVKVWIFKGEVMSRAEESTSEQTAEHTPAA